MSNDEENPIKLKHGMTFPLGILDNSPDGKCIVVNCDESLNTRWASKKNFCCYHQKLRGEYHRKKYYEKMGWDYTPRPVRK